MHAAIRSAEDNTSILTTQHNVSSIPQRFNTGSFNLPSKLKQVAKQVHRSLPEALPEPDANVHEVRYFLFQLLTVASYKIAKVWPQWILETCANWNGTGADLRALGTKELHNLCPLDSGHCEIDQHEKTAQYPPPDCRKHIGEVISATVSNMKAKEDQKAKLEKEWRETQLGHSARQIAFSGLSQNLGPWERHQIQPNLRQPSPVKRAMTIMSAPLFPARTKQDRTREGRYDAISSVTFTRAHSTAPMYDYQTIAGTQNFSQLKSPTTSGGDSGSSGNISNSTVRTSPPGSDELRSMHVNHPTPAIPAISTRSMIAPRPVHQFRSAASAHILRDFTQKQWDASSRFGYLAPNGNSAQQLLDISGTPQHTYQKQPLRHINQVPSLDHTYFPNFNSRTATPNIVNLAAPYIQRTKFNDPHNIYLYPKLIANGTLNTKTPPDPQDEQSLPEKNPSGLGHRTVCSVSLTPDDSISIAGAFREMQLEDQVSVTQPELSAQKPPHITGPVHHQYFDSSPFRNPMHPNSMHYPRPDISGPRYLSQRATSPVPSAIPSVASSTVRSIGPSLVRQFPINRKRSVPVVSSTEGPHRSAATSQTDQFAFSQAEYLSFKKRKGQTRTEVIEAEVERMHGMVPSHLHGAGVEHIGPSVRVMNPATGQPFPTLVEQIREREILDGRSQRGASGLGGLDCEYLRNHQYFFRGT